MASGISEHDRFVPGERKPPIFRPAITLAFISGMAIIFLMVVVSYRATNSLIENSSWLSHTHQVLEDLHTLESRLQRAESLQGRYLITGDDAFLASYQADVQSTRELEGKLFQLTTDNRVQQQSLHDLDRLISAKVEHMDHTLLSRQTDGLTPGLQKSIASEGRRRMENIQAKIADMSMEENRLLATRTTAQQKSAEGSLRSILFGGTLAMLFLAISGIALQRDAQRRFVIERRLQRTTALQLAILNSANYAIFSTGPAGTIVSFNSAAEKFLGYHATEVIGRLTPVSFHEPTEMNRQAEQLSRFFGQNISPGFDTLIARAKLGTVDESEWNYVRRDGSRFSGLLSTSAMHDEEGSITGYLFVVSDITRRKEAERARDQIELRYRALLQNSSDTVVVIDPIGRVQYISPAVERLLEFEVQDLIGREIFDLVHPSDVEAAQQALQNVSAGPGSPQTLELRLRRANGEHVTTELVANNLLQDEVLHGIVLNVRDISERTRARAQLEVQNAVARVLANAVDLTQSIPEILQALCTNLDWELSEFWGVDPEENVLRFNFAWSLPGFDLQAFLRISEQIRIHSGEGLAGRVWQRKTAIQVSDITHEENFVRRTEVEALSLRAAIGFPIQSRESVIGVFTLFSLRNRHIDADLLAMLNTVGAQIGQFIARKRAEQQISENEDRYHYLFENSADLIMTFAPDGAMLHLNAAWSPALGFSREELMKKTIYDLVPPEDVEECRTTIDRGLLSGSLERVEFVFLANDGHRVIVEGSINCRYGIAGIEYCNAIFQDVTKRREIDRMKNEFISVVSHELRTPLTSIRGSLGLLAGGGMLKNQEKAGRMLDIALKNTERLVRLINDILDIEKIESGKISLDIQPIDASDLLLQASATMLSMAETNGVRLDVKPQPGTVFADRDRMLQTLTNLLSNAIKFSSPGKVVALSAEPRGGGLLVRVRDEGRGIPSTKLHSIFERFQQVDASDSRDKGGTGLGLAICRSIVQQHGGAIWVDSSEGKGSEFFVLLPKFQAETAQTSSSDSATNAARPS